MMCKSDVRERVKCKFKQSSVVAGWRPGNATVSDSQRPGLASMSHTLPWNPIFSFGVRGDY